MVLSIIIVCEVGFWVAIVSGLAVRYLLRRPSLGAALLVVAPVLDAVLLVATTLDLLGGATATWQHSLAAIYVGFSVAYGHRLIAWVDVRFAHRFAGGPGPAALTGRAYTRACWGDVGRTLLGASIAASVIGLIVLVVGWSDRTRALGDTLPLLGLALALDLLWAIGYTVWPKPPAASASGAEGAPVDA
jgi:hypothetical protein